MKNKIKARRIELGMTLKQVAQEVGVSEATVSRWESGDIGDMRRGKIYALSQALKMSPIDVMELDSPSIVSRYDYDGIKIEPSNAEKELIDFYRKSDTDHKLQARADLGIDEISVPLDQNEYTQLSPDERMVAEEYKKNPNSIIKRYFSLDNHGKEAVNAILDIERKRMEKPNIIPFYEKIIEMDEYLTPVSAGTGEIALDDCPKNPINVVDNAYTRKANFIVRVKGDSMIPRFFDGDRLLIQSAGIPNFGEIGIWCVDGQTYVKQAGNGELLSLNSNYEPIRLRGRDCRCEGKVIGVLDPAWIRK